MNNLSSIIDKYDLKVSKYSYKNKAIILDTEKGNFVLKKRKRNDKKELYDYLLSRNFSFFLYPENNFNDDYESLLKQIKKLSELLFNLAKQIVVKKSWYERAYTTADNKAVHTALASWVTLIK